MNISLKNRVIKMMLAISLIAISELTSAQILSTPQIKFLGRESKAIALNKEYKNGDWTKLGKAIGNKKIVLLGEFNHETHEVFKIKNDFIKYLHEKHGFNTILFESGIGELIIPNQQKNSLSPKAMTYGFFGYWRTKEFVDLMKYVQTKNINISGFDVQRFGGSFSIFLKSVAEKEGIDSLRYVGIEDTFGQVQDLLTDRKTLFDSARNPTELLVRRYETLYDEFPESLEKDILLVKQTIKNRIHYLRFRLDFLKNRNWNQRWIDRDSMMAENVNWLLDNFYPDEKVIVYAHNFHIAKYNEKEEVMGEYLSKTMREEMYSVGFFAGSGTYGNNEVLSDPDSTRLDIKHIITQLDAGINFLHIPTGKKKGSEWLFKPIVVNDTFIDLSSSQTMTLSKQFDGLIFIDKISSEKKE